MKLSPALSLAAGKNQMEGLLGTGMLTIPSSVSGNSNDYLTRPLVPVVTPATASGRWSQVAAAAEFACALDAISGHAYCWG